MGFILFGNSREPYVVPLLLFQDGADEIILMQTLHNNNDDSIPLVILPAVEGVVEPFIDRFALGFRQCLVGLQRVVDNDEVCTSTGQHASHRGGQPKAVLGG